MLVALNKEGVRTLSWEAQQGQAYFCPECQDELVYKAGIVKVEHFAHFPDSKCTLSTCESIRHLEMKKTVKQIWPEATLERSIETIDRRADLVMGFDTDQGYESPGIVVECQVTPITLSDWLQRTMDYNKAGYAVLWVWAIERVSGPYEEKRIGEEIRACHFLSYGRVYAIENTPVLYSCHLSKVERENEWLGYSYYLKTTKKTEIYEIPPKQLKRIGFKSSRGNLFLCKLNEGVWWKHGNE